MKAFEQRVKKIFGIDFTRWYCLVFLKRATPETMARIRKVKPQAYRELQKFLEPFIQKVEKEKL